MIVANKGIFGGAGVYSARGSKMLRMVGRKTWPVTEIQVARITGGHRQKQRGVGIWKRAIQPPYMPESMADPYHPGGNSLCYTIQTAHLMGCNPIYALGFTLKSGTGYFFGRTNPATRRVSLYDADRALDWLRWYEATFPGRVKLLPGWEGPIYDVFSTEGFDEYGRVLGVGSDQEGEGSRERNPVSRSEDADEVIRSGQDRKGRTPELW